MSGPADPAAILGVILAGGQARRFGGGDKCLLPLAGRPLLAHVIGQLRPQLGRLVLNANGDPARFAAFGLAVIADTLAGHPGPLAGLLAGLRHAEALASSLPLDKPAEPSHVLTVPADTPFLPADLVERLIMALAEGRAEIAIATSDGRVHPVVALVPIACADRLEADLRAGTARRVEPWLRGFAVAEVVFSGDPDPFFNVNTAEDLAIAESLAAGRP